MKYNFFNEPIYSPMDISKQSEKIKGFIKKQFSEILEKSVSFDDTVDLIDKYKGEGILKVEEKLREKIIDINELKSKLNERSQIIFNQLNSVLKKNKIKKRDKFCFLDYGCGDGLVSKLIKDNYHNSTPILADVYDFLTQEVEINHFSYVLGNQYNIEEFEKEIRTKLCSQYGKDSFDIIFFLTVLHHVNCPSRAFCSAYNLLKNNGYIIVIESVVGVTLTELIDGEKNNLKIKLSSNDEYILYTSLSKNEQIFYGIFLDWFYNRVIHKNIDVPYNFTDTVTWKSFFEGFKGIKQESIYYFGFDQPLVKEFHTLHILRKVIK